MKIIVFGNTTESAYNKLDEILALIPYGEIKEVRKNKYDCKVELKNGTIYLVVPASQSARGYKCDKVYIQYGVDREIVECVIKPILNFSKLDEDEQIEWF